MPSPLFKISFLPGLKDIVKKEISEHSELHIIRETDDEIYLDSLFDFSILKKLKSITRAYILVEDAKFNPLHISRHKSILGNLLEIILKEKSEKFTSFKIYCAGSNSPEVKSIEAYVADTFKIKPSEDPDLKIHMIRPIDSWEIAIQITPRPISVREYRVNNLEGALNPTVAYAMNSFCNLTDAASYLNIFSGSGTLLIEAGLIAKDTNPSLKLIGFDIDGKRNALAIDNIKKAGLVKSIMLKTADINSAPDLGMFDVITSDLPFGMVIGKETKIESLYRTFIKYAESTLNPNGTLVVYTTEKDIFEECITSSKFTIKDTLDLKIVTNVNSFIYPRIFVCRFCETNTPQVLSIPSSL